MNVPNILTTLRIVLIPVFVTLLIYRYYPAAIIVLTVAGTTDVLDGYLARRWRQSTTVGTFLDPLADKFLTVASYVTLSLRGPIPVWIAALVISRDIIISLGSLVIYLSQGSLEIRPSPLGKATTFCQIFTILATVIVMIAGRGWSFWEGALLVTGALTLLSGLQYLWRGLAVLSAPESG